MSSKLAEERIAESSANAPAAKVLINTKVISFFSNAPHLTRRRLLTEQLPRRVGDHYNAPGQHQYVSVRASPLAQLNHRLIDACIDPSFHNLLGFRITALDQVVDVRHQYASTLRQFHNHPAQQVYPWRHAFHFGVFLRGVDVAADNSESVKCWCTHAC